MNLDEQMQFINIINDEFKTMKSMLDRINARIAEYPVYTQLEFIKPLKEIILYAYLDSNDKNDNFLNNHDGGDKIEVCS